MKQEQIRTIKIVVAYDGSDFIGWQRQNLPGGKQRSVQATLEQAFRQLSGETIVLHGAGRTDAGVHSLGQVASFRTQTAIPLERLQLAWDRQLPGDVRVLQCQEMPMGFHARYDAIGKQYQYFFSLQNEISPFQFQHVYHCPYALDLPKMQEAAKCFQGRHQFESFAAKGSPVRHYEREIYLTDLAPVPLAESWLPWQQTGQIWRFAVFGNGFLYKMVRLLMGALLRVGMGRLTITDLEQALSKPQPILAPPAPPQGLYMTKVYYDQAELTKDCQNLSEKAQ